MGRKKEYEKESVKLKRRKCGTIYRWPDGRACYLASRRNRDIYKARHTFVTHALENGQAMWSIESQILLQLRHKGVTAVGVMNNDTKDIYLTSLKNFMEQGRVVASRRKNGSMQRSLPLQAFRLRRGIIRL